MKRFASILVLVLVAYTNVNGSGPRGAGRLSGGGWIPAQTFIMGDASGADCESGIVNPSGPPEEQLTGHAVRALRGGAYYQPPAFQTCAYRCGTADTKGCFSFNGFRVARPAPSKSEPVKANKR